MIFLQAALTVVFLYGSDAEPIMSNFTDCTLVEYLCDLRKCETQFIKSVQKDPKGDCRAKYERTLNCVIMSGKLCGRTNPFPETPMEVLLRRGIPQKSMCDEGLMGQNLIPYELGEFLYNCSIWFTNNTKTCLKAFHEKFTTDKSDPTLCKEQATAKQCWKKVIKSDCKLPSRVEKGVDFFLGDYNPFCANNWDIGVAGKDECYGVRDINNPFNNHTTRSNPFNISEATGLKIGVLQALLFLFVSFIFA